jgi:EAL domain-containing protein (putative c-di-GMP-specific phosphodiesterase class I)
MLAAGAITTVHQPIVRLKDGEVLGWEALSRTALEPHLPPLLWLEAADATGSRLDLELACLRAAIPPARHPVRRCCS